MKIPFQLNQTVFHPIYGKCVVGGLDESPDSTHRVYLKDIGWERVKLISYEPWPKPVHEKPFTPVLQKGDWIVARGRGTGSECYTTVIRELANRVETSHKVFYKDVFEFFRVLKDPIEFN